ncbi:MAG: CHASE sensor domain-containing protein [Verrucomicrobiia bacterium]|jgi:signal transduction histidine kinase
MNRSFQNLPIKAKLMAVMMLTCSAALLLSCVGFVGYQLLSYIRDEKQNLATVGDVIAANSTAALSFRDQSSAEETLRGLKAEPSILNACLYAQDGTLFATYARDGSGQSCPATAAPGGSGTFEYNHLTLSRSVMLNGRNIGTLCLQADIAPEVVAYLKRAVTILLCVMGASLLAALFLSRKLQYFISEPLSGLVTGTQELAAGNLSVRVAAASTDEFGELARAFNEMAGSLQQSHAEILNYQQTLELRVKDRTLELENMHKQLLDISRDAGMAEVATNVLHNVGNVLNSVNVSTALVSEKIRESRVSSLAKAVALMRAHQNDLAAFFTQDTKGMQLCDYLDNLAQYLGKEQTGMLKEIESLSANVEHIREIVTMQQSYARAAGIVDTLPIVDLVEDALRMNNGALVRHEVQVVREYIATPSVPVDKHKVLQILVNLVRNAKYALDDGGRKDKLLTVRVATDSDGFVKILVIDNGVGIPPENLTRIFSYGFTTRKNGHGFGLHSGALAAKEMGGSLSVHSDGPGQGATFTLSLPFHQEHENV